MSSLQPLPVPRNHWLRSPTVRLGLETGACLSLVLMTWLIVANRMDSLAGYAEVRNVAAAGMVGLVMLIPVLRYWKSPAQMFASGLLAWGVLSFAYLLLGLFFVRLYNRMGTLHVFMLGAGIYGFLSVFAWASSLVLAARRQPIAASRRRIY